jgi:radical SAM superfamily enzyme YgiQ (UPF0313 family)
LGSAFVFLCVPLWIKILWTIMPKARRNQHRRNQPSTTPTQASPLAREEGTIVKNWGGKIPVALSFPNSYYVGMSSLAFQLLYSRLNAEEDVVCERVFWEKGGAAAGNPLLSLENQRPADEFDVWAFTISWEMDYFNVVEMLRQANVPPLAQDRHASTRWDGTEWPILIAGGPGITMNPEPMAPFFDVILIGEGEEALPQFVELCRQGLYEDRQALLATLDKLPGF